MNPAKLAQIDALVAQDIKDKKLPGAVVLVGHKGKIVFRKAYGNRSLVPTVEPMTVDTIFDLASLTKVVATTTSIMILVEQGKLRLSETIGKYIPEIQDEQVKRVTIQQLMTHTSGFAPDFDLKEKWTGREGMLQALYKEKLRTSPHPGKSLGPFLETVGGDEGSTDSILVTHEHTLDDAEFARRLPAGSAGTAAVFTAHVKSAHVIRKVLLRQIAILNYINPF